ncbi:nucleoside recognition domain-containing protein, partial [Bacillus mycoides]|uniref:nucleoside recognition domain-containing protein n=1 Tax=Bacillus mycoides TaxID=1405 RepID=UPI003CC7F2E8
MAPLPPLLLFLPQIFPLFFFISLLQHSPYIPPIPLLIHPIIHFFPLNPKPFIPIIIPFRSNVPRIIPPRTIHHQKQTLLTLLLTPFISSSPPFPLYPLFPQLFF